MNKRNSKNYKLTRIRDLVSTFNKLLFRLSNFLPAKSYKLLNFISLMAKKLSFSNLITLL